MLTYIWMEQFLVSEFAFVKQGMHGDQNSLATQNKTLFWHDLTQTDKLSIPMMQMRQTVSISMQKRWLQRQS